MKKITFVLVLILVMSVLFSGCNPMSFLEKLGANSGDDSEQVSDEEESAPEFADAAFTEENIDQKSVV